MSSASPCSFMTTALPSGRKGACCAGQDIHDAARVAERLGIPALCARLREPVPRRSDRGFRRELPPRRDAGPVHPLQSSGSSSAICWRRRAISAPRRWPPGIMRAASPGRTGPNCTARATRRATRAISCVARRASELDFLRFPLGGLHKDETRAARARVGLPVADKPDSQDICFVPHGSYAGFVERLRPEAGEPGDIVDRSGRVLGRHDGIAHFTVGQRKGLGIAAAEPLYVLRIDPEQPARHRRPEERAGRDARSSRRAQLARPPLQRRRMVPVIGQAALDAAAGLRQPSMPAL